MKIIPLLISTLAMAMLASAQDTASSGSGKLLLNFQRTSAYMESDSAAPHAQGMEGLTSRNPGSTTHYPTTNECISIYADGSYSFERVEEKSYGKPKVRVYKGTLAAPQLAKLQSITGDDAFRKVVITEMPEPPENATGVREGEIIQTTVMRDSSGFSVRPTTRESMLNPRAEKSPDTRERTPGSFITNADITCRMDTPQLRTL